MPRKPKPITITNTNYWLIKRRNLICPFFVYLPASLGLSGSEHPLSSLSYATLMLSSYLSITYMYSIFHVVAFFRSSLLSIAHHSSNSVLSNNQGPCVYLKEEYDRQLNATVNHSLGVASGEYPANCVCRILQPVFGSFRKSVCWIWQILVD